MSNATEWDLIRLCRRGSQAAFEPLVRRYERPALAVATGLLGDADEAADAVQDAFVRAWGTLDRLEEGSAFGPWFRTILRNLCLDRLRAPRHTRRVSLEPGTVDAGAAQAAAAAERSADASRVVEDALAALSPEHRSILVLREMEGFGYRDIARTMDVPEGTVASRLHHARAALRAELERRGVGPSDLA